MLMGPRGLNKFLRSHNPSGIRQIGLNQLAGKKIVIDVSIYLYRFNVNNELFENFYNMLILFKKYKIIPLFVFDGKPPTEKQETLKIRKQERINAEKIYNNLVETNMLQHHNKHNIEMLKRRKTMVSIKNKDELKLMFDYYGVMYIDAPCEADQLCAYYVKTKQAWACLSDDMDLFVYGCEKILRYFSLVNENVIYYDLNEILKSLKITFDCFQNICILSGTDYNNPICNIEQSFRIYNKLLKNKTQSDIEKVFETELIQNNNYDILKQLYILPYLDDYHVNIEYKKQDNVNLRLMLSKYDFIFI